MGEPKRLCSSRKTPHLPPESGGSLLPKCAHSLKTQDQGALFMFFEKNILNFLPIGKENIFPSIFEELFTSKKRNFKIWITIEQKLGLYF